MLSDVEKPKHEHNFFATKIIFCSSIFIFQSISKGTNASRLLSGFGHCHFRIPGVLCGENIGMYRESALCSNSSVQCQ